MEGLLYRVGTGNEVAKLRDKLPKLAYEELLRTTRSLDAAYGANRDYLSSGGYSLVAETAEDLETIKETLDYDTHPCEWATEIGGFVMALYLMNDDFSITLVIPGSITPEKIKNDLEA